MDTSIFYVILSVGIAFGLTWLISYFRKKKIFEKEDLLTAIKILDLNLRIVGELNLQKEDKIKSISEIVIDSLEFAISYYDNPEDIIQNAYNYALDVCLAFNIEMTEQRENILWELINITFNNKYIDFVEEEIN